MSTRLLKSGASEGCWRWLRSIHPFNAACFSVNNLNSGLSTHNRILRVNIGGQESRLFKSTVLTSNLQAITEARLCGTRHISSIQKRNCQSNGGSQARLNIIPEIKLHSWRLYSVPTRTGTRMFRSNAAKEKNRRSVIIYITAIGIFMVGATYAGVPLYRMLCQTTGLGGEVQKGHDTSKVESMVPVRERILKVRFNADTASSMQWNFRPHQTEIRVLPGETALAFYKARNPTDVPVVGISTYNVVPFEAAQYFNKIQCFCFEEQRLNPHEEVDLPVFFYIDPEFCDDPRMEHVDIITLSYTFFEAKEGMTLPVFNYSPTRHI